MYLEDIFEAYITKNIRKDRSKIAHQLRGTLWHEHWSNHKAHRNRHKWDYWNLGRKCHYSWWCCSRCYSGFICCCFWWWIIQPWKNRCRSNSYRHCRDLFRLCFHGIWSWSTCSRLRGGRWGKNRGNRVANQCRWTRGLSCIISGFSRVRRLQSSLCRCRQICLSSWSSWKRILGCCNRWVRPDQGCTSLRRTLLPSKMDSWSIKERQQRSWWGHRSCH